MLHTKHTTGILFVLLKLEQSQNNNKIKLWKNNDLLWVFTFLKTFKKLKYKPKIRITRKYKN